MSVRRSRCISGHFWPMTDAIFCASDSTWFSASEPLPVTDRSACLIRLSTSLKTCVHTPTREIEKESECVIGETVVPEGQPLVKLQFNTQEAWELRKSGDLMGVSIGAKATIVEVDE